MFACFYYFSIWWWQKVKKAVSNGSFLGSVANVPTSSSVTAVTKRALPNRWAPILRLIFSFLFFHFFFFSVLNFCVTVSVLLSFLDSLCSFLYLYTDNDTMCLSRFPPAYRCPIEKSSNSVTRRSLTRNHHQQGTLAKRKDKNKNIKSRLEEEEDERHIVECSRPSFLKKKKKRFQCQQFSRGMY